MLVNIAQTLKHRLVLELKKKSDVIDDDVEPSDAANRGHVSQTVEAPEGDALDTKAHLDEGEVSVLENDEVVYRTPSSYRYTGDSNLRDASLDTLEHRRRGSVRAS